MQELTASAETLDDWAPADRLPQSVPAVIASIAKAGRAIDDLVSREPYPPSQHCGKDSDRNTDERQELVSQAKSILVGALSRVPLAAIAFIGTNTILPSRADAALCAAVVPLSGATQVEASAGGTIFSIFPAILEEDRPTSSCFLQPGHRQVAAGYIIYGARTTLVFAVGSGTQVFVLNRRAETFERSTAKHEIPRKARRLAIDSSTSQRWDAPVRQYVDDWIEVHDGNLDACFQVQPSASLIANCHRVLMRGGVQLYPAELGQSDAADCPSLVFHANPIAWLIEQAGGKASTGTTRVTDIVPATIDQRTPLVIGSADGVESVEQYYRCADKSLVRSPLFSRRGLFLA